MAGASMTLLDIVQDILSDMDSEEVNAIDETVEAAQVARIVKRCYYDMLSDMDYTETEGLFQLTASGDNALPCVMYIPDNIRNIYWVKYDSLVSGETVSNYKELTRITLPDMVTISNGNKDVATIVDTMSVAGKEGDTFDFYVKNNTAPKKYAVMDNYTMIFDSYDSDVDTTLQKSKTMVFGSYYPAWTNSDNFTPDLNISQFSYLVAKAKDRCFTLLKQQTNSTIAKEARRQLIAYQRNEHKQEKAPAVYSAPRYGRK